MLFEFNIYSSLLLIGVCQGIVYSSLLLWRGKREGSVADFLMAAILITLSIYVSQWMLGFAGWYDVKDWHTTFMFYMDFDLPYLLGPLMYCFFLASTNRKFSLPFYWKHFVLALLFILFVIGVAVYDFVYWKSWLGNPFLGFDGTRGPMEDYLNEDSIPILTLVWQLARLHLLVYVGLTIRLFWNYKKYLNNNFSNTEAIDMQWYRNVLLLFAGALIVELLKQLINLFFDLSYIDTWYFYFVTSIVIYLLGIQAYKQPSRQVVELSFQPNQIEQTLILEEKSNHLEPELQRLLQKLQHLMEMEKPYLNSDLNLRSLANQLKTNTNYLSKVINHTDATNFNDYINRYRVQEMQQRLKNGAHKEFTFLSLALECGFNSKATFNRAFKKHTGKSPRAYIEQLE